MSPACLTLSKTQAARGSPAFAPGLPQTPAQQHREDGCVESDFAEAPFARAHPEMVQHAQHRHRIHQPVQGLASAWRPSALIARLNEVAASGSISSSALKPTRMKGRLAMSRAIALKSRP